MATFIVRKPWELPDTLATDERFSKERRAFIKAVGLGAAGGLLTPGSLPHAEPPQAAARAARAIQPVTEPAMRAAFANFAEFSHWRAQVPARARHLDTGDWSLRVGGLVRKPLSIEVGELAAWLGLRERVYRFCCIEGWSMVIPWLGFELRQLIDAVRPDPRARFVRFSGLYDPAIAPEQVRNDWHEWPYTVALSLAEARHELSFLATGAYGVPLPNAQGAPLRLVVPWKYATVSIKSIARIEFVDRRPASSWTGARNRNGDATCNVMPTDPATGKQRHEIMVGTGATRLTEAYNGYGEFVGHLYG